MAANWYRRVEIWVRDGYRCRSCRRPVDTDQGIVGHLNHRIQKGYNRPSNLRLSCRGCEITFHFRHLNQPDSIGLSREQNLDAMILQYGRMAGAEKEDFRKWHPGIAHLLDQYE